MSFWGWIIMLAASAVFCMYIERKRWSKLIKSLTEWVVVTIFAFLGLTFFPSTSSFTGDIKKDEKIVVERIKKGEDFDEVINDLMMYYLEKGYNMPDIKELLKEMNLEL